MFEDGDAHSDYAHSDYAHGDYAHGDDAHGDDALVGSKTLLKRGGLGRKRVPHTHQTRTIPVRMPMKSIQNAQTRRKAAKDLTADG